MRPLRNGKIIASLILCVLAVGALASFRNGDVERATRSTRSSATAAADAVIRGARVVGSPPDTSLEDAVSQATGIVLAGIDSELARVSEWVESLPVPVRVAASWVLPDAGGECSNPVVPESVARRESGCRWDAYNPTGCGGRGCLGFYQLDAGHFAATSPWNSNVSGSCYGLDPSTQAGQTECASRLGPGAWG